MAVVASTLLLGGCHDIEHSPTAPASPPRSQTAVRINIVLTLGELPVGGGSANISVEALGSDGGGISTPVALSVSEGELGAASVTTDRTGHAIASWQGTKTTNITAISGDAIRDESHDFPDDHVSPSPIQGRWHGSGARILLLEAAFSASIVSVSSVECIPARSVDRYGETSRPFWAAYRTNTKPA